MFSQQWGIRECGIPVCQRRHGLGPEEPQERQQRPFLRRVRRGRWLDWEGDRRGRVLRSGDLKFFSAKAKNSLIPLTLEDQAFNRKETLWSFANNCWIGYAETTLKSWALKMVLRQLVAWQLIPRAILSGHLTLFSQWTLNTFCPFLGPDFRVELTQCFKTLTGMKAGLIITGFYEVGPSKRSSWKHWKIFFLIPRLINNIYQLTKQPNKAAHVRLLISYIFLNVCADTGQTF